jgi:large subunit ribosomal protein L13
MKTYVAKLSEIKRNWWLIDAENLVLGRLAATAATLLRGKHKPMYTPNLDCGDNVIIINAEKVFLTGKKAEQRQYYWHTGYPGGIKSTTPEKTLATEYPERVIERAIRRMIPRENLGRAQMRKLFIYQGSEHPHAPQNPQKFDQAAKNPKNKKRAG